MCPVAVARRKRKKAAPHLVRVVDEGPIAMFGSGRWGEGVAHLIPLWRACRGKTRGQEQLVGPKAVFCVWCFMLLGLNVCVRFIVLMFPCGDKASIVICFSAEHQWATIAPLTVGICPLFPWVF